MREHQWVVIATFFLTEDEVMEAHRSGGQLALDTSRLRKQDIPPPFCYQCERLWIDVHDKPCSGDPTAARAAIDLHLDASAMEKFSRE